MRTDDLIRHRELLESELRLDHARRCLAAQEDWVRCHAQHPGLRVATDLLAQMRASVAAMETYHLALRRSLVLQGRLKPVDATQAFPVGATPAQQQLPPPAAGTQPAPFAPSPGPGSAPGHGREPG